MMKIDNPNGQTGPKNLTSLGASLLILLVFAWLAASRLAMFKDWIIRCGPFGFLLGIGLFGLLGASPIPSEPVTVVISGLFGPFQAMLITCLGNLLAASVEYFIGGQVNQAVDFQVWRDRLPFGLGRLPADSPAFLILGRMLPGVGPKAVSLIGGMYQVPAGRYLWTTFISTLIGAAVVSYGAAGALRLFGWN